jgi:hypothetical protein
MKTRLFLFVVVFVLATNARSAEERPTPAPDDAQLEKQITGMVNQLSTAKAVDREAMEKQLLDLAGTTSAQSDRFLTLLPKDNDQMPLALRDRLSRIRKQVENRTAKVATKGSTVTLSAKDMPLADVLKSIEQQTGNKFIDNRDEEPDAKGTKITIELKNEPFWSAVDQILDQAKLGINNYGGEEALTLVARGNNDGPRKGSAVYEGPFRIEAIQVQAERNLRQSKEAALKLQFEVGWEPRLRPIAVSQPPADVHATTDNGIALSITQPDALQDVDVPVGTQAAEVMLPLSLPDRQAKKIASLKGKLHALVPGRHAKFQFDKFTKSIGKSQSLGGVKITLDDVRKNGAIWEIHMRFTLDETNTVLQSHRDWVLQNISYLVDENGRRIENAGFESTRQTPSEVGVAYFFDVDQDLAGLTWVYETPAAVADLPISYELKNIELP